MPRLNSSDRWRGPRPIALVPLLALGAFLLAALELSAQTLKGSAASLDLQNREARRHDFTYLRTPAQVSTFVELGLLMKLRGNSDYELHQVSFPYARPEVSVFVERLATQYRDACGQKLVVTSLTRPLSRQPANASDRSVHPTGMAVDLRRPNIGGCRSWLEGILLQLEGMGVLDATRESRPPHYHVVLFPRQYSTYVGRIVARTTEVAAAATAETEDELAEEAVDFAQDGGESVDEMLAAAPAPETYRVRAGDSLWTIAQKTGTTVARLRAENALRSNRIYAGQVIIIPGR
jgi:LysM repeat protein